jgi:hypothetical protein
LNEKLFKVYTQYSKGEIDANKFLYKVDKEIAPVTPELRNYLKKHQDNA